MRQLHRRDWVLIVILLISSLVCIRLGFWQLDRLGQRLNRNARVEMRLKSPPENFAPDMEDYSAVIIEGTFVDEYQIVLQNRTLNDVSGYHLVTPLQTGDDRLVLIDRGWIPYEDGATFSLDGYGIPGPVRVEGVLLPGEAQPRWGFLADPIPEPGGAPLRSWRLLDISGIQRQIPSALHHQYIALRTIDPAGDHQPVPDYQPDLSNGPHLSYAIQWFSFSAIALIGGAVLVRNRIRKG
jgi:surfeit locus 1 family protein